MLSLVARQSLRQVPFRHCSFQAQNVFLSATDVKRSFSYVTQNSAKATFGAIQLGRSSVGFFLRHKKLIAVAVLVGIVAVAEFSSRSPLKDPSLRLTGSIINSPLRLDSFSVELERCSGMNQIKDRGAHSPSFLSWYDTYQIESIALSYRNFLGRVLFLDDTLRLEKGTLQSKINNEQKEHLEAFLSEVRDFLNSNSRSIKKGEVFGQLVRLYAASVVRFKGDENPLQPHEQKQLFERLCDLEKKAAMHLISESDKTLIAMSEEDVSSIKSLTVEERRLYLDLILPLNVGVTPDQLEHFVGELPRPAAELLLPLIKRRNDVVTLDPLWEKLVDRRLEERKTIEIKLRNADIKAKDACKELSEYPLFARTLLNFGSYYHDDLFRNHYVMGFISLLAYHRSPHIGILFDEQHLNKQMNAAKEKVLENETDPNVLMIRSSLDESKKWIPCTEVPFGNTFIPDEFQRLVRNADLNSIENLDSSCQVEENKIYYFPGRGLCYHNPYSVPEKAEHYAPFEILNSSHQDAFTPVVSYRAENATLRGTHAFSEITFDGRRFVMGKFSRFQFHYGNFRTYWRFFWDVAPHILSEHPTIILSPDQNVGYHDRRIVKLDHPIPIGKIQKERLYQLLRDHDQGTPGTEFKAVPYNCTALPEKMLNVVGICLPCHAPVKSLVEIGHPNLKRKIRWLSDHPRISTIFWRSLGWVFGATGENALTEEVLNRAMTPYVLRLWMELENCSEKIKEIRKKQERYVK